MQKIVFPSLGKYIVGNLLLPNCTNPPGVLLLHGAGHSHKEKFLEMQKALLTKGFASFAIDFTGVGESEGTFADGSLEVRLQNAQDSLDQLKKCADSNNLAVLGSSMGGFLAPLIATSNTGVRQAILLAAAAYSPDAENKKLTKDFTKVITQPESFENSRSFTALEKFAGKVLVLYGEKDTTIPQEIQTRYRKIASAKGEWYTIANAEHNLIAPEDKKQKENVIHIITNFLTNS